MMKNILHTGLFLLLAAAPAFSQSLYEDVQKLVRALDTLQNTGQPDEAAVARASATVLAILNQYDQGAGSDAIRAGSWEELRQHYAGNALVKGLLPDSLPLTPAGLEEPGFMREARGIAVRINSGERQKIVQKMYAEQAVSPADYLSVSNTLERYRAPVFPPMEALQLSAENSNKNFRNGTLNPQAAILEGLALFILNRAKDEVVINFLDRLLKEETPHFGALFPTVVAEFGNADFTYSESFIARLRQSFYEDFQKLSVRLPLLLLEDDYFKDLQADPVAYNLMALYSLVGLTQFDLPIEEAIPATNRYLYGSYTEKIKDVNLTLAEKAPGSPEYDQLIALSDSVTRQLKAIYLFLNTTEFALGDSILGTQINFPEAPPPPDVNDFLGSSAYTLKTLFGDDKEYGLNMLPQLLRGRLDSAYMVQYNTLDSYDKYFGTERSPQQWRAAGLELAKKLNGAWYNDQTIAGILYDWQRDLDRYQEAVHHWMEDADPGGILLRANRKFEADTLALRRTIRADKEFWRGHSQLNPDEVLAFNALDNLLAPGVFQNIAAEVQLDAISNPRLSGRMAAEILDRSRAHVAAVEQRFFALDTALYAKNPGLYNTSPSRIYLLGRQLDAPNTFVKSQIYELENTLSGLNRQLGVVEGSFAGALSKGRDNAEPILQSTELVSGLMYCLRSNDPDKKWLNAGQLDTLLDGSRMEAAFLGLMQQRLSQTKQIGLLSPTALTDLVRLTIKDLDLLAGPDLPDSLQVKDSLAFFRKAAFAVNTLNRILELPLVSAGQGRAGFTPLKNHWPKLEQVPEISERVLHFIYYLNIKDHGKAISALIRVFASLNLNMAETAVPAGKKDNNKRQSAILYLQKYGDFIAGLLDARVARDVEELLKQISDPPGSSRIKRKSPLTVSLNAYLGGTFGGERWTGNALPSGETMWALAPTMPVGITISHLFGKNKCSISAFISFLDVGALLTYQPESSQSVESDFNFKNMFKPGLQLHWNIKKSPFYLGAGWQYGPQFVQVNNEKKIVKANRYFIGFGVDVPIRTLYQR